ncbi:MAG: hypothetical protein Q7R35_12065 [Elusimicrobiota bacterium]|nr:hypothetical protein [Elusimicrobiota bacterium]
MEEDIDKESHHIREVYAQYGLAMYQAQCFERGIAIVLASVYGIQPKDGTRSMYQKTLEGHFERTLGGLVKELGKAARLPLEFEANIKDALKKRNWLAHNYFWDRADSFFSSDGREKMLLELRETAYLFKKLDEYLAAISMAWGEKHGVTPQMIEKDMESLILNADCEFGE